GEAGEAGDEGVEGRRPVEEEAELEALAHRQRQALEEVVEVDRLLKGEVAVEVGEGGREPGGDLRARRRLVGPARAEVGDVPLVDAEAAGEAVVDGLLDVGAGAVDEGHLPAAVEDLF